ncbi:MAG: acetyl-CoA carboxylase biotin carboxyl carrier protein [Fibrobacteria bacterium]|nr:acetyl-CoA carboxylase biotin carboxyl carrier protein [Fibrobacteria bacterium]
MKLQEIKDLMKFMDKSGLSELNWKEGESSVLLKKGSDNVVFSTPAQTAAVLPAAPVPVTPVPDVENSSPSAAVSANIHEIKAPMVGTVYISPSPDASPYVKSGDTVKKGQVLCIIEAMKLMNEIESDVDGVVESVLVDSETPVEYGTVMFQINKG